LKQKSSLEYTLKTFVQLVNGHNTFAHPPKFDKLLTEVIFFVSITN